MAKTNVQLMNDIYGLKLMLAAEVKKNQGLTSYINELKEEVRQLEATVKPQKGN